MTTNTYPAHRVADVALRDGSTARFRPIRIEDEAALAEFLRGLSLESRSFRFFSGGVNFEAMARQQCQVDYVDTYGLVATVGSTERLVGHGMYVRTEPHRAEVAFAIADDFQGRGLATLMLGQLAEFAAANQIETFDAEVMPQNHRMLNLFRHSGFPIATHADFASIHVEFPTALTPAALIAFEQREQRAAISALRHFFTPQSVAVIGASRRRESVSGALFHNLLDYGFNGPVYPVNPRAEVVQSVVAYPNVEAVPGGVELAVIAVPASEVLATVAACGRKGVKALVVISAGFGETDAAGRDRQAELVKLCRQFGLRLIGPNCMGIFSTNAEVRLNATFAPGALTAGRVAFASQSGALGISVIDYAQALNLGISHFVSMGNKADISGNDLLNYWADDPLTDVILLYLESFGNPRKFARIARRVGRQKPIIVVKSGRSTAGARAATSHTGALLAASDITVDTLFRQAGVIRADTLAELFDIAGLLTSQPAPSGTAVGIVTNAGGPAILCADAAEARGLTAPELTDATKAALRAILPAEASVGNPVDLVASATPAQFKQAVEIVGRDPTIDAVIAIFIPPLVTRTEDVARALVDAAPNLPPEKPLLAVMMSTAAPPSCLAAASPRIPCYAFPEAAAVALAHAAHYGVWRRQPIAEPATLENLRRDEAASIIARSLGGGGGWLEPSDVAALLNCYGIELVATRFVATAEAAGDAAAAIGGPVALKAVAPGLIHKSDVGGVALDLIGADVTRDAAATMARRLRDHGVELTGYVAQAMAPKGVEMLVGIVHDPSFGPILACGAGGVEVELVKDVTVRLTPISRDDATTMIRELKTAPRLFGYRGSTPVDVGALESVLLRLGALAEDLPSVAELDCNPIIVHPAGAVVVDARVRVAPINPPPLGARR